MFQFAFPSLFVRFRYEPPAFEPFLRLPLLHRKSSLMGLCPSPLRGFTPEGHLIAGEDEPGRVPKPVREVQARAPGIRTVPEATAH